MENWVKILQIIKNGENLCLTLGFVKDLLVFKPKHFLNETNSSHYLANESNSTSCYFNSNSIWGGSSSVGRQ